MILVYSDWKKTFVIFPKKTITGKTIFCEEAYIRLAWNVYGDTRNHYDPKKQYATIFDVLADTENDFTF